MTVSVADVRGALTEVLDPEYPVSLVDLGLVRDVAVAEGTATVTISYCSLGCPCIQLTSRTSRAPARAGRDRPRGGRRVVRPLDAPRHLEAGSRPAARGGRRTSDAAEPWEVFARQDAKIPIRHIGRVDAVTLDDAIVFASTLYEEEVERHVHRAAARIEQVVQPA